MVFGCSANFQRKGPSIPLGTTGLKLHTERTRANSVGIHGSDQTNASSFANREDFGTAPLNCSATSPFLKNKIAGIALIL